jgi:hypothetical protein
LHICIPPVARKKAPQVAINLQSQTEGQVAIKLSTFRIFMVFPVGCLVSIPIELSYPNHQTRRLRTAQLDDGIVDTLVSIDAWAGVRGRGATFRCLANRTKAAIRDDFAGEDPGKKQAIVEGLKWGWWLCRRRAQKTLRLIRLERACRREMGDYKAHPV